jgi:hypothetical protein
MDFTENTRNVRHLSFHLAIVPAGDMTFATDVWQRDWRNRREV